MLIIIKKNFFSKKKKKISTYKHLGFERPVSVHFMQFDEFVTYCLILNGNEVKETGMPIR